MAVHLVLTDASPDGILPALRTTGVDLKVEPGKTASWTYRYEFYPVEKK